MPTPAQWHSSRAPATRAHQLRDDRAVPDSARLHRRRAVADRAGCRRGRRCDRERRDRTGEYEWSGDLHHDRSIPGSGRELRALPWKNPRVGSPQTLSEADRRIVAGWAADCAERALALFESEAPGDRRPRDAIARARAFSGGDLDVAEQIRGRFAGGDAARDVTAPAAVAAARAAGQAASIPHMGAHALGAAAYAATAVGLAAPDRPLAVNEEIGWQSHRCRPRSEPRCVCCHQWVRTRPVLSGRGSSIGPTRRGHP